MLDLDPRGNFRFSCPTGSEERLAWSSRLRVRGEVPIDACAESSSLVCQSREWSRDHTIGRLWLDARESGGVGEVGLRNYLIFGDRK